MKECLITSLIFLIGISLNAQTTFNYRYHFDFPAAVLTSIEVTDSCYYTTGIVADSIFPYNTGILFARFDLEGQLVFLKTIRDTVKTYETWTNHLTPIENNQFALTGYSYELSGMKGLFMVFNDSGDTLFTKSYLSTDYPNNEFIFPKDMQRDQNGNYILLLWEESSPGSGEFALLKINSEGEELWRKKFTSPLREQSGSLAITSEDKIVIGGHRTNVNLVTENYISQANIIQTDSLGEIEWEYLTNDFEIKFIVNDFLLLENGEIVYVGGNGIEVDASSVNLLVFNGAMYKLNQNQNPEWSTNLGNGNYGSYFNKLIELENGEGYLAAGTIFIPSPDSIGYGGDQSGWLAKVSVDGDSIWSRYYNYVESLYDDHHLYDLEQTNDGGFIMVGQATGFHSGDTIPTPSQQAWILKVDEQGCLIPGCHTVPVVEIEGRKIALKLYPNPTSDYLNIWIDSEDFPRDAYFRIINQSGQEVQRFKNNFHEITHIVSLENYSDGLYYLQYLEKSKLVITDKFIVTH